jgi:hypothetical protein
VPRCRNFRWGGPRDERPGEASSIIEKLRKFDRKDCGWGPMSSQRTWIIEMLQGPKTTDGWFCCCDPVRYHCGNGSRIWASSVHYLQWCTEGILRCQTCRGCSLARSHAIEKFHRSGELCCSLSKQLPIALLLFWLRC